jgi:uncharacterized protein
MANEQPSMDAAEILRQLTHYERLPRAALQAASQQHAEMLPVFLSEIDRFLAADAERRAEPNPLFFIFHLLGEWREPSAYRPLARLLRCGSDDVQHTIDEAVTTTSHRVMAAVFDGDPDPLYGIILDPDADEYGRARMFDALTMQVLAGRLPRDAVERFLHHCFDHMQPQDTCFVWDGWQHAVAALGLSAMTAQVKTAFDREFIEPFVTNFEYFEKDLAYAREHPEAPVRDHKDYTLFGDTIEELSSWYGFSEHFERERERSEKKAARSGVLLWSAASRQPMVNTFGKVGRNEPCPCGSGKKFKKCCMP